MSQEVRAMRRLQQQLQLRGVTVDRAALQSVVEYVLEAGCSEQQAVDDLLRGITALELPGPTPAHHEAVPGPTPAHHEAVPGPTPAHHEAVPGPTPAHHEAVPGPTPAHHEAAPGPTPAHHEAVPGPTPAHHEAVPGPTPAHHHACPPPRLTSRPSFLSSPLSHNGSGRAGGSSRGEHAGGGARPDVLGGVGRNGGAGEVMEGGRGEAVEGWMREWRALVVIDGFSMARVDYDPLRKHFSRSTLPAPALRLWGTGGPMATTPPNCGCALSCSFTCDLTPFLHHHAPYCTTTPFLFPPLKLSPPHMPHLPCPPPCPQPHVHYMRAGTVGHCPWRGRLTARRTCCGAACTCCWRARPATAASPCRCCLWAPLSSSRSSTPRCHAMQHGQGGHGEEGLGRLGQWVKGKKLEFLNSFSEFLFLALSLPCKTPTVLPPPPCPPSSPRVQLTPVQALVGGTAASQQRRHHVVGVLAQLEDGRFFLEDLSASLPLDLSHAISALRSAPFPFSPHSLLALLSSSRSPLPPVSIAPPAPPHEQAWVQQREAEGVAEGHMFIIMADIALHDPQVTPHSSLLTPSPWHTSPCTTPSWDFPVLNFSPPSHSPRKCPLLSPLHHICMDVLRQTLSRLATLLGAYDAVNDPLRLFASLPFTQDASLAVSPCCLPLPSPLHHLCMCDRQTLSRLATVLGAYDALDEPPRLFLLIGDFCSPPTALASPHLHAHREAFSQLARVIGAHRRLKDKSLFVFVPGQADPGPCAVLPRPSLPRFFTDPITDALPSAVFSSNPSRIKFYSQELVVLRADLQRRMQRCAVLPPLKDTDPFTHVATTVVHQAHLSPLPLAAQPVFWDYDFTLHLFPAPHV
ncbi:unnamed protein product, partial [Closterium sp. NIES-53]